MSVQNVKVLRLFLLSVLGLILTVGCKNQEKDSSDEENLKTVEKSRDSDDVFTIVTQSMEFKFPKDTLHSGWNTIRYRNNSNETHFVVFEKYPEGKGIEDARDSVIPVFQKGMDLIVDGENEAAMQEFGNLPAWFNEVIFAGGVGLVSPKTTAESSIKLEPGTYLIECYVKMANGVFHSTQGMVEEIYVKEEKSSLKEPVADYNITIGGEEGISMEGNPSSGDHNFKVEFLDQKQHENFVGHDVHLVRVEPGLDLNILASWLDWSNPEGLITPSPEGVKFIGGMQEMEAGNVGYFKANLKPGSYVLISEVPNQKEKGLLHEFEVK